MVRIKGVVVYHGGKFIEAQVISVTDPISNPKPPVSVLRLRVSAQAIDPGQLVGEVSHPSSGAVVVFLGTVRDYSRGRQGITHLEYEAYQEMVEEKITQVVDEALAQWPINAVVVEHRVGRVELSEASVGVAVSCAHRAEAFAAAQYIIDLLKEKAPIWKKEVWPEGEEWSPGS